MVMLNRVVFLDGGLAHAATDGFGPIFGRRCPAATREEQATGDDHEQGDHERRHRCSGAGGLLFQRFTAKEVSKAETIPTY